MGRSQISPQPVFHFVKNVGWCDQVKMNLDGEVICEKVHAIMWAFLQNHIIIR